MSRENNIEKALIAAHAEKPFRDAVHELGKTGNLHDATREQLEQNASDAGEKAVNIEELKNQKVKPEEIEDLSKRYANAILGRIDSKSTDLEFFYGLLDLINWYDELQGGEIFAEKNFGKLSAPQQYGAWRKENFFNLIKSILEKCGSADLLIKKISNKIEKEGADDFDKEFGRNVINKIQNLK